MKKVSLVLYVIKVSRQHDHSAVILNNIVKMYPFMRRNTPTSSPAVTLSCLLIINTVWTKKRQMETQISIQLVMMTISIKPMILATRYFSRTRNFITSNFLCCLKVGQQEKTPSPPKLTDALDLLKLTFHMICLNPSSIINKRLYMPVKNRMQLKEKNASC